MAEKLPRLPCIVDACDNVLSFAPITNSENTKVSYVLVLDSGRLILFSCNTTLLLSLTLIFILLLVSKGQNTGLITLETV